jgi:hypothetical protein
MGETILKTNIKREPGYLYYTGTDDNGNIILCKTEMARGKKKILKIKKK